MLRSILTTFVLFGVILLVGGCSMSQSRSDNYYAYAARSAGDGAITVVGDQAKVDASDMAVIAACALEVEKFLQSGAVSNLTGGALADQLKNQIPLEYQSYFTVVLNYLSATNVDPSAVVPERILRLMRNATHGVYTGASYWVAPSTE